MDRQQCGLSSWVKYVVDREIGAEENCDVLMETKSDESTELNIGPYNSIPVPTGSDLGSKKTPSMEPGRIPFAALRCIQNRCKLDTASTLHASASTYPSPTAEPLISGDA
ncbi:hypothetical protein L2E82_27063 [Cichorium intybus]|uniref:Uncharacterized protein n=1 Tax=Cichorium intybus TaxID=13427 RepID=A0ACB9CSB4_CICIN|nr:hypothetical protein L2E82_27063 [Cichorium intybus]